MNLSEQEFLDSISNPLTKKEYKHGLKRFVEWFNKPVEEILKIRQDDLTQRIGENLIEYKNRASKFEKIIEKFHAYLLTKYSINTARTVTLGIRQLFRFYEMPIRFRAGSKINKSVKTTSSFPLTIEHIRRMYAIADLRERVILSIATDLGLRIGDFVSIKKNQIPTADQESPISFDVMTNKEDVIAHGFLSKESIDLLKVYLPTLEEKNNPYLFPSNGQSHLSDEWIGKLLKRLAREAKLNLNGKKLTFHCFRKMFLSGSIDSGIGLIAGKMLCGKTIAQSDETYLTTVKLRQKFIQLKNFLSINEQPTIKTEDIEPLKKAISKLQEDLTIQKTITTTITEKNLKIEKEYGEIKKQIEQLLPKQEKPSEISQGEQDYMDKIFEQDQKYRKEHPEEFKLKPETEEQRKFREEHEPQEYLDAQHTAHLENEVEHLREEQEKDRKRLKEIEKILKINKK